MQSRAKLNEYWRNQRTAIREAKERRLTKSLDPHVFLTNKALLYQVVSWICSQGGESYARKELARLGVSSAAGIEAIIQSARKEIAR